MGHTVQLNCAWHTSQALDHRATCHPTCEHILMQLHHHRYSYYDQLVSLRMLPLRRLVLWTRRLRAQVFKSADIDPRVVFAGTRLGGFCGTGHLPMLHVFGRAASVVNLQGIPCHLS